MTKRKRPDPEAAAEQVMEEIDAHELASSKVPQQASVEFYRAIAQMCQQRANTIRGEMGG